MALVFAGLSRSKSSVIDNVWELMMTRRVRFDDVELRIRADSEREKRKAEEKSVAEKEREEMTRRQAQADRELERRVRGWFPRHPPDEEYLRPHPNDTGRRQIVSPAGELRGRAGKGVKILSGPFEQGKGR